MIKGKGAARAPVSRFSTGALASLVAASALWGSVSCVGQRAQFNSDVAASSAQKDKVRKAIQAEFVLMVRLGQGSATQAVDSNNLGRLSEKISALVLEDLLNPNETNLSDLVALSAPPKIQPGGTLDDGNVQEFKKAVIPRLLAFSSLSAWAQGDGPLLVGAELGITDHTDLIQPSPHDKNPKD